MVVKKKSPEANTEKAAPTAAQNKAQSAKSAEILALAAEFNQIASSNFITIPDRHKLFTQFIARNAKDMETVRQLRDYCNTIVHCVPAFVYFGVPSNALHDGKTLDRLQMLGTGMYRIAGSSGNNFQEYLNIVTKPDEAWAKKIIVPCDYSLNERNDARRAAVLSFPEIGKPRNPNRGGSYFQSSAFHVPEIAETKAAKTFITILKSGIKLPDEVIENMVGHYLLSLLPPIASIHSFSKFYNLAEPPKTTTLSCANGDMLVSDFMSVWTDLCAINKEITLFHSDSDPRHWADLCATKSRFPETGHRSDLTLIYNLNLTDALAHFVSSRVISSDMIAMVEELIRYAKYEIISYFIYTGMQSAAKHIQETKSK